MKIFCTLMAILFALTVAASAQTKRVESTTTETMADTAGGKVTTNSTVTTVSTTEDITPRRHMISSDPFKFWVFYNMSYYHAITNNIVVGGGIQTPTALADREISGFGVNLEGRYYIGGKPFRGFHINPVLSVNSISYERYDWEAAGNERVHDTPITFGVLMGWHWYPWDEFGTQIAFGADYNISPTSEENLLGMGSHKKGIIPTAHFTVGYSW
jgi:hypothetical protein